MDVDKNSLSFDISDLYELVYGTGEHSTRMLPV